VTSRFYRPLTDCAPESKRKNRGPRERYLPSAGTSQRRARRARRPFGPTAERKGEPTPAESTERGRDIRGGGAEPLEREPAAMRPERPRGGRQRLRNAEDFAMRLTGGGLRDEARQGWPGEPLPRDHEGEGEQQVDGAAGERHPGEAEPETGRAHNHQGRLGHAPREPPDEPALDHHRHEPHIDEEAVDARFAVAEESLRRERKRPLEHREAERHQEEDGEQHPRPGGRGGGAQRF